MPIPNAVLEAEKRASKLIEEANAPTGEQPPTQQPPTPAPAEPESPPQEGSAEYWKRRFEVVQGKLNAEVPRLSEQVRQQAERIQVLEQVPPAPIVKPKLVTDAEVQEYTPEFLDMIERAAEQRVATMLAERDAKLDAMQKELHSVRQNVGVTARDRYLAKLDELFPAKAEGQPPYWRVLNDQANTAFYAWLGEVDPISGFTRMEGMKAADQALDVERVANILRAYLREAGEQAPPVSSHPPQPHNAQILPPQPMGSPTPSSGPTLGRLWKRSEINALYDAERRGMYRGRIDEFKRLEADIFAAQADGRITDG